MRQFQKKINEIEDKFNAGEETPETIQWFYEQMLALINDEDFAEEVLYNGACFDALWTPTLDEDYSPDDRAEVQWEGVFTPEQEKGLEDAANAQIDDYIEGLDMDCPENNPWAYWPY